MNYNNSHIKRYHSPLHPEHVCQTCEQGWIELQVPDYKSDPNFDYHNQVLKWEKNKTHPSRYIKNTDDIVRALMACPDCEGTGANANRITTQKNRKKAVFCVLCDYPTENPEGVCNRCFKTYQHGKDRIKEIEANNVVSIFLGDGFFEYKHLYQGVYEFRELTYKDYISGVLESSFKKLKNHTYCNSDEIDVIYNYQTNTFEEPEAKTTYSGTIYNGNQVTFKWLMGIISYTNEQLKRLEQQSKNDSKHLLVNIASGKIDIDEVNKTLYGGK